MPPASDPHTSDTGRAGPGQPAPGRPDTDRPTPDEPTEVFRLHPLTPIALGGRILGVLIVLTLLGLVDHSSGSTGTLYRTYIFGGLAMVMVIRGIVMVAVTRYHLEGGELRVDSGLLQKQAKRIRLDRVQSVDILEPFSARIFGLAEVKVTTAGSERAAVRLRYLSAPVAQGLRADLLRRGADARGGAGMAIEAPERPLLRVPHGRLIGSIVLQLLSWRLLLLAVGPVLAAIGAKNSHGVTVGLGIALFIAVGIAVLTSIWQQLNAFWDFTVGDAADGLRVRHGLLSTSRQTVPPGRIQAIRIHQPLSWRPFGWAQVRMNVAGYGRSDASRRTMLIPVADRHYAEQFVGWLLGSTELAEVSLTRPPRRAALRAPLWWRYELAGADDRLFVVHHGLLSRTVEVVPHERTQSLRLTAGPWERALGLASLHLDSTRGPVKTRAAHRGAGDARAMLDRQIDRARIARGSQRPAPLPGPRTT